MLQASPLLEQAHGGKKDELINLQNLIAWIRGNDGHLNEEQQETFKLTVSELVRILILMPLECTALKPDCIKESNYKSQVIKTVSRVLKKLICADLPEYRTPAVQETLSVIRQILNK